MSSTGETRFLIIERGGKSCKSTGPLFHRSTLAPCAQFHNGEEHFRCSCTVVQLFHKASLFQKECRQSSRECRPSPVAVRSSRGEPNPAHAVQDESRACTLRPPPRCLQDHAHPTCLILDFPKHPQQRNWDGRNSSCLWSLENGTVRNPRLFPVHRLDTGRRIFRCSCTLQPSFTGPSDHEPGCERWMKLGLMLRPTAT